jgi:hypothetical protein
MKDEPLDPATMMKIINELKAEGRLPSAEEFVGAVMRIREEYRQEMADARSKQKKKVRHNRPN